MISPQTVARIKACKGMYSVRDTARFFNVSKSSVHDIWAGRRHTAVPEAPEPANVISTRISPDLLIEDAQTLLGRGMKVTEVARELGVSHSTLYRHINRTGRNVGLYVA